MDRQFAALQFLLIGLCFVLSSVPSGFNYAAFNNPDAVAGDAPPDPYFKIQWISLTLLGMAIIWRRRHLAMQLVTGINPLLIAFFAWCATTSLWAVEPSKTFTQSFVMVLVGLIAFSTTLTAWQPDTLPRVLRPVLTMFLVICAIVAVFNPGLGVESGDQFELRDSWRGAAMTKNVLGQVGAVAVIIWVHAWATRATRPVYAGLGFAFSAFVMLKSRSSTSLLLSVLSAGILAAMLRSPIRLQGKRAIVGLSVALLVLTPIFIYLVLVGTLAYDDIASPIGHAVGKDATFSGRTPIWAEVWTRIQTHPWLGVGFMGFWNGPDSLAGDIIRDLQWPIPHSHNGYLDMWNELGGIGLLLFVGFLVFHLRQIFLLNDRNRESFALHFVFVPYLLFANVTETGWFRPVSLTLVLSLYSSMTLTRLLFEQRMQSAVAGRMAAATTAPKPAALVAWGGR